MKVEEIKNILILGSGTLGLRVALVCAINNYKVKVFDVDENVFVKAKTIQNTIISNLVRRKVITQEVGDKAITNLTFTTDPIFAAENIDLVNESVPENLDLKKKVWLQFSKLCSAKTIFTTNTSSLMPSHFARETRRPNMFCAFHFHDVFYANVVDIMPNPLTEKWIPHLLYGFAKTIQQIPVTINVESPGYIFNAMLISTFTSAGKLVANGIASIEDVDRSWMGNFKVPVGPFAMMDEIGLQTVLNVIDGVNDPNNEKFAKLIRQYVNNGKLGVKTDEGFYIYPNPIFKKENFLE